jgi:uncharacterized Zn finger protein
MGWYYDYRPYVSVAQRRQRAMREMEKRRKKGLAVSPVVISGRIIARTFWGKAWCENLESYSDFENRLPRGRTYARNGSVVHLEIHPGKISAFVSGSELYKVDISISALPGPHWKRVKGECAGKIGSLVELLQGRLSQNIMDVVTQRGAGLFPKPAEIQMKCSCPDWAGMCKHVAAVMYGIGTRLDERPDLLFLLRKVDHLELIAGAVDSVPAAKAGKAQGKKTIAAGELADVFGIEMAEGETVRGDQSTIAEKSMKPEFRATEPKVKKFAVRAAAKGKKTTRATPAKNGKPKPAKVRAQAAEPASRKTTSRKRSKQAVS